MIVYADGGTALRERIQMATGALKVLSGVWPIVGLIMQQVKEVARGIFIFGNNARPITMDNTMVVEDGDVLFTNDDLWLKEMIDHLLAQEDSDDAAFGR